MNSNQLIDQLEQLLLKHGRKLPPTEERRFLWRVIAQTRNEEVIREFGSYVTANSSRIHPMLHSEIIRILND